MAWSSTFLSESDIPLEEYQLEEDVPDWVKKWVRAAVRWAYRTFDPGEQEKRAFIRRRARHWRGASWDDIEDLFNYLSKTFGAWWRVHNPSFQEIARGRVLPEIEAFHKATGIERLAIYQALYQLAKKQDPEFGVEGFALESVLGPQFHDLQADTTEFVERLLHHSQTRKRATHARRKKRSRTPSSR